MKYNLATFVAILLMLSPRLSATKKLFTIFWNTTNPMFRIDNTDHIIDVNRDNEPYEFDQANLICPYYPQGADPTKVERYIIYSVSREEYENCRIISPNPKVVAVCDEPHKLMYFTITFRAFTPTPGGLEFYPGQDYFFISTSSQRDLYRHVGGRCSTNNMKATFKVAPQVDAGSNSDAAKNANRVNLPRGLSSSRRRNTPGTGQDDQPYPVYRDVKPEFKSNSLEDTADEDELVKQASVMHQGDSNAARRASLSFTASLVVVIFTALVASSAIELLHQGTPVR